jgi:dihydroorotase
MTKLLLRNARVLDPGRGVDGQLDVAIADGKIAAIAKEHAVEPDTEVLELSGLVVSPGWFDAHMHLYGGLGMRTPDCVGVYAGVTAVLDAGGSGPLTFREFDAVVPEAQHTDVYCYVMMLPYGLHFSNGQRGNLHELTALPLADFTELAAARRDRIVGFKALGFGDFGPGPVQVAKGVAQTAGLPLYLHIGDFMVPPREVTTPRLFDFLEAGDIATHCYTSSYGGYLDAEGRVYPQALAAVRRGVLIDVAMGSFNFAFDVAEKGMAQGLLPDLLTSDIQNNNITGPTYSLANVMSMFLALGFTLPEVVQRVTANPARALGLADRLGSLEVGRDADVTVFAVDEGDWSFADCEGQSRAGRQRLRPVMTFKRGRRFDCDPAVAQQEANWRIVPAIETVPAATAEFDAAQRAFLGRLRQRLVDAPWEGEVLTRVWQEVREEVGVPLRDAARAVVTSLLDPPFSVQVGWLLKKFERGFVLRRLDAIALAPEGKS